MAMPDVSRQERRSMDVGGSSHTPPSSLVIGLVNNIPPAARLLAEQQFMDLLTTSSQSLNVRISFFVVDAPSRGDDTVSLVQQAGLDALIVTGAEPRGDTMTDEPSWPVMARLVDWAADHTISAMWSCLAAHAAVFRLDQIGRKRFPRKLSGVFQCLKAADHPLLAEAPAAWPVPHSRYNTLDEAELRRKGYTVLSHVPHLGVDSFIKQTPSSLFLMLQGHPEYHADSLRNEYRRDVRRFLSGQRNDYPNIPQDYFDPVTTDMLLQLHEQACQIPAIDLLASVDAAIAVAPQQIWYPHAVRLFANWLRYIAQQKAEREAAVTWPMQQWRAAS